MFFNSRGIRGSQAEILIILERGTVASRRVSELGRNCVARALRDDDRASVPARDPQLVVEERVRLRGRLRRIVKRERLDGGDDFRIRDSIVGRIKGLAQARLGSHACRRHRIESAGAQYGCEDDFTGHL